MYVNLFLKSRWNESLKKNIIIKYVKCAIKTPIIVFLFNSSNSVFYTLFFLLFYITTYTIQAIKKGI